MKIKWIFFDVGSTLVDESEAYDHRAREMIKTTGITFEEFDSKRRELAALGYDGNSSAIKFFNLKRTPWPVEYETLYSDVHCTLKKFKSKGYNLGIIANQISGLNERLKRWNIFHYFDIIVSSSEVGVLKPDARIFEYAISKSGCTSAECLMVGDRLDNDIIPAIKIGMKTAWVKNGLSLLQNDALANNFANYIVYSMAELYDKIIQEE